MGEDRVYTVEEADAMLPDLRERLVRIREARQQLLRSAEVVKARVATDGGGAAGDPGYWEAQASLRAEIERLAREDIALRDPESGLVDFPGERDGRRVWLCWRLGEERVAHWHELDSGFVGRQPL
ncbi:MAG TPA: DUF2203 domain-containing protein [Actinomycetota bacterium]|jgi:hypothetical protein